MKFTHKLWLVLILLCCPWPSRAGTPEPALNAQGRHVLLVSIDGLRPDAIEALGPEGAPVFHRLLEEGAATLNARTDPDATITLPNHTSMLTGLGVKGENGHNYIHNHETRQTLHHIKGRYIGSVFNEVHQSGLKTAMFSSKEKFRIYAKSYGAKGAYQQKNYTYWGDQNIDVYCTSHTNDDVVLDAFLEQWHNAPPDFTFLHFAGPDNVGHDFHWDVRPGSLYLKEVRRQDARLGRILEVIGSDPAGGGSTVLIITSDHGGEGDKHWDTGNPLNYRVPFIVWGAGVAKGDLYALNPSTRRDPGYGQVPYGSRPQPVRNGDAANLVLSLLGLPSLPGSTINFEQDLNVSGLLKKNAPRSQPSDHGAN